MPESVIIYVIILQEPVQLLLFLCSTTCLHLHVHGGEHVFPPVVLSLLNVIELAV